MCSSDLIIFSIQKIFLKIRSLICVLKYISTESIYKRENKNRIAGTDNAQYEQIQNTPFALTDKPKDQFFPLLQITIEFASKDTEKGSITWVLSVRK